MKIVDVVVVGSGPAGATAAFKLAEKGISVALIEKEILPRYKTCGGGLSLKGRNMLPFNLESVIESEFQTIDTYFFNQKIHLQSKRDLPVVSMIMRDKFDSLIVENAKKMGITVFENNKLVDLKFGDNLITLVTNRMEIQAKFIIAADGALSPTAKLAGWHNDTRYTAPALEYEVELNSKVFNQLNNQARIDFDFVPHGYAWCFPKKNHLSIGVISFLRTKLDLKKYYTDYLCFLNIKENDILHEDAHGFIIPISRRKDGFVKNNVFLIGDAAGFADPISAEGISNAIYTGILAAESIIESNLEPAEAEKCYNEKLNKHLIPELKSAEYLSKLFYKQVKIRNFLISKSGNKFCDYMTDIFIGEKNIQRI
jgi:geranylgeranyl reductase family protein